jgi:predicted nucleic acid-binding protein
MDELPPAVLDTSVLINFLIIDRIDLLTRHPAYRFILSEHVRDEIHTDYQDEVTRLDIAIAGNGFTITSLDATNQIFVQLMQERRYGIGECAAIALAIGMGCPLAIDDRRATAAARHLRPTIQIESTESLMISQISYGGLSIIDADRIKETWEKHYRFRLPFASFADRLA